MRLQRLIHPTLAMVFILAGTCAWAAKSMADVPLVWKPTSTLQDFKLPPINLTPLRGLRILVTPFTNACKDRTLIGENLENSTPKTIRTNADVAAFVTDHTRDILEGLGFPLTDRPEAANISLSGEVFRFGVVERNTYVGDVRIKLTIHRGGEVLWEGVAIGQASRFGRSYKLENYHNVLSDSLLEAVARMGSSSAFLDGFAKKPAPSDLKSPEPTTSATAQTRPRPAQGN